METLVANLIAGAARRETLAGREYLVRRVVMAKSGVMAGSKGPLYYPEAELGKEPYIWNGMPLTAGHPVVDGKHVSARSPDVLANYWLGWVFNAGYSSALEAEAWFDVARTAEYDRTLPAAARLLPRIKAGDPIEVSTGLFADNAPVENGQAPDGTAYTHLATNYRADHLAILADGAVGACPVAAGCGVNPVGNQAGGTEMEKAKAVKWLVTNCACWKGKQKALEAMDDPTVKAIHEGAVANAVVGAAKKGWGNISITVNAEGDGEVAPGVSIADLAAFFGVEVNPAEDPIGFTKELKSKMEAVLTKLDPASPEPSKDAADAPPADVPAAPTGNKKTGTGPMANKRKLTMKEAMEVLPDEMIAGLQMASQVVREKHAALVETVVNSQFPDKASRDAARPAYAEMRIDRLELIAKSLPRRQQQPQVNQYPMFPGFPPVGSPQEPELAVNKMFGGVGYDEDDADWPEFDDRGNIVNAGTAATDAE